MLLLLFGVGRSRPLGGGAGPSTAGPVGPLCLHPGHAYIIYSPSGSRRKPMFASQRKLATLALDHLRGVFGHGVQTFEADFWLLLGIRQ